MAAGYVGRFAPSPTGFLHFGSLLAALVSYLDARCRDGRWLVRMEDIDPAREMPGAADHILRQLERHGMHWDGEVLFQSSRLPAYREVLAELLDGGRAFYCRCSRREVKAAGGIYDGHCLRRPFVPAGAPAAVRIHVPVDTIIAFDDLFQGRQRQCLDREVGDFIIRRKDGLFAYQLACALDDAFQGITDVVRGADLLGSTARQIWLITELGYGAPVYGHLPVALNAGGQKLSKQNLATDIDVLAPEENLRLALAWLGFPAAPEAASAAELLTWAAACWRREMLAGKGAAPAPEMYLGERASLAGSPQSE